MGMNRVDFSKPITIEIYKGNDLVDSLILKGEVAFKDLFLCTPVRDFIVNICLLQSLCDDLKGNSLLTAFCRVQKSVDFLDSIKSEIVNPNILLVFEEIKEFVTKQVLDGEIYIHFYKLSV